MGQRIRTKSSLAHSVKVVPSQTRVQTVTNRARHPITQVTLASAHQALAHSSLPKHRQRSLSRIKTEIARKSASMRKNRQQEASQLMFRPKNGICAKNAIAGKIHKWKCAKQSIATSPVYPPTCLARVV